MGFSPPFRQSNHSHPTQTNHSANPRRNPKPAESQRFTKNP
ncbi:hypothetical protein NMA510612_0057 [Neisseria meningitidis]|uniref:Uncharacterized protein n=1 Tax=Neisseria meningitidis TaxID=487 RepID=X5EN70_NEIME|nr:hypothetical protein NMA510612_0057 [Neisseria meningitidis]